ncbi:MAG: FliA/WhiG family RNA polymerase sigma factor [Dehalococcoidia bacterium]|nr:FliA/WhiG family RNA polymerase sigma factor [Dehalococcoidia bacterium]MCA9849667.1 FliA/WhiG family RNA polymerase sigma factor [Dehalococcoidia bacterium]MCA9855878.1 FliA/WhiG family RNA polymerase sigma factor [Dehalococcoidia bacterium]MCB9492049.1 FliA/WhiG family RNA polymerase sigma factor [Dehalococcoidia bacterium]
MPNPRPKPTSRPAGKSAGANTPTPIASARRARAGAVEPAEQQRLNQALWERYFDEHDPAVREQLILQYAPLVKYVMGRLAISLPAILDYEDILSFGTIGLIEAVERFDHTKGVKFETYAIARIRGAIIDALRSLDRLPRSVRQKARDANEAILRLTNELGRDPTDEEVAEAMGVTPDVYRQTQVESSWITVSLDTLGASDGEEDTGGAMAVADPDGEDFSADLERQELIGDLALAIRDLPDREQLILSLYYKEELTMREVSEVLGISESRVCQLHARALTRLRAGVTSRQQGQAA